MGVHRGCFIAAMDFRLGVQPFPPFFLRIASEALLLQQEARVNERIGWLPREVK